MPQGWVKVPIAELFEFKYGKGLPQEKRNHGEINVYGSNGVVGQHDDVVTHGPTIIIGRKGSVGEVHLSQQPCWPIDTTYFIDQFPAGLPPQYWALYLKSLCLGQQEKSSAIPGISREDIYKIKVPLPPLKEQRRIVAKLEELLVKVDVSQKRLEKIPLILKRFRQAVLAAACSGRLTTDWREENTDCVGANLVFAQKEGQSQGLPLQNGGEGEELPEGWEVTCVSKLASLITSGSRGWAQYYADSGSIFIRAQNINSDFLDLSDVAYVRLPDQTEGLRTKIQKDDLLITITGANVTKSARVSDHLGDAYVSQHVALVRLKDISLSPFLFLFIVSSAHGRAQLLDAAYGQGKPGLNLDNIRSVRVPLPPLPEQHEIVRCVEALFTLADQLEVRYQKAKAHVDRLTQSILAKAFRGELVPRDPADEPASVLLERIRAERAKSAPAPRSKVTPRPAQKTYTSKPEPLPLAAEPAVAYGPTIPDRILSAMQPGRDYSRADVTVASGITDAEWLWAIRQLKEEGRVRQTGERRGARYRRA